MLNLLKAFRRDEHGVILSAEIVIVGTVLVIGVMTGMACLQKSVNNELGDLAKAFDSIDQSYSFSGHRKAGRSNGSGDCCAFTAGSAFVNNECNANVCQNDIIGCEGQVMLHSESCGTCSSCGGQCSDGGVCGSCGTAGFSDSNRPDCVSTGVPNMKVTEYPGTSVVPRTTNEGKSALRFPELESQPPVHELGQPPGPTLEPDCDPGILGPLHEVDQTEPGGPVQPNAPDSATTNEPLLPVPQNQPLPVVPPSELQK